MLRFYTSRLITKTEVKKINITAKNGDKTFAPSWDLVLNLRDGNITQEEYTEKYYAQMRKSYVKNRRRWNEVLNMDEVTFCCFCEDDAFCHTYLFADILVKLGATYLGRIPYER